MSELIELTNEQFGRLKEKEILITTQNILAYANQLPLNNENC